ncbi:MAG: DNA/RNA non-specific endonuclease [Paludibacteraceae bacterium]|nr:DNA/RNA non-specific endonuclease [Paludibacteraceae bacterium]
MKRNILLISILFLFISAFGQVKELKYSFGTVYFDEAICLPIKAVETIKPHPGKAYERKGKFHVDSLELCAVPYNYPTGYDRGHLIPANDANYSQQTESDCFVMTNMTPQLAAFNRGIWKKLETYCRKSLVGNDSLVVESGILTTDLKKIGAVNVPTLFYKKITFYPSKKVEYYQLKNEKSNLPLSSFLQP